MTSYWVWWWWWRRSESKSGYGGGTEYFAAEAFDRLTNFGGIKLKVKQLLERIN